MQWPEHDCRSFLRQPGAVGDTELAFGGPVDSRRNARRPGVSVKLNGRSAASTGKACRSMPATTLMSKIPNPFPENGDCFPVLSAVKSARNSCRCVDPTTGWRRQLGLPRQPSKVTARLGGRRGVGTETARAANRSIAPSRTALHGRFSRSRASGPHGLLG